MHDTHTAMSLQVLADAAQVDPQPMQMSIVAVVVRQDLLQVEVEDVGVDAADVHAVLEEVERSEVRLGSKSLTRMIYLQEHRWK